MFEINWLDLFSVLLTFAIAWLVHRNDHLVPSKQLAEENPPTSPSNDNKKSRNSLKISSPTDSPNENAVQFRRSTLDTAESSSDAASRRTSSTSLTSSDSIGSASKSNGNSPPEAITHTISFDTLNDEYREDEDTISFENLFPCDQSEIYASKKINYIIEELVQTEANYVCNLRKGLANYGARLQEWPDAPEALKGTERQVKLLGNVADILELHESQVLPLMQRNQHDLKTLFDEMSLLFDQDKFYCYVLFTMNEKSSKELRDENRALLQKYQMDINDKLGIESFLVQPIQRLTRYPLLLQQFISEFYKSSISCKPVLSSVCKLETRTRRLLDVVNQAEQISSIDNLNGLDLTAQGHFRRATEFDALHYPTRKRYRAKIFLFDGCVVCTELRKRGELSYRQHYDWQAVELQRSLDNTKCVRLLLKPSAKPGAAASTSTKRDEYKFTAHEASVIKQWLQTTHKILETARLEYTRREKYSLPIELPLGALFVASLLVPLDLVLGVGVVLWLSWQRYTRAQ